MFKVFLNVSQKDTCKFLELLSLLSVPAWESKSKDNAMKRSIGFLMLAPTNNQKSFQLSFWSFVQCILCYYIFITLYHLCLCFYMFITHCLLHLHFCILITFYFLRFLFMFFHHPLPFVWLFTFSLSFALLFLHSHHHLPLDLKALMCVIKHLRYFIFQRHLYVWLCI